eukprot:TRINITY_DN3461_c0_g1_i7.p1 TRINITY_DN3461_c0_g1~~TRINITY_DN3461_c0_g1_i7.p1  ORF type:complete len:696 (-),score=171.25 TRINITY_DN3461_c0_g1_i7:78-2165(-)
MEAPPPPPPPTRVRQQRAAGAEDMKAQLARKASAATGSGEQTAPPQRAARFDLARERSPCGCGLENQGATCYMNSLLQTLFYIPEFRRFVYQWGSKHVITKELQKLFARMQAGKWASTETRALTLSFGWTEADAFQQQDVQELLRVLFEALDFIYTSAVIEAADSPGAAAALPTTSPITALFSGILVDAKHCLVCNRVKTRIDPYSDISLVIDAASSVEEALAQFVAPETLQNENSVFCEACNRNTPTAKYFRLKTLPQILTIQLKRFQYDTVTWRRFKINKNVSYPLQLDMAPFLDDPSDMSVETRYELFSVLLHSGGAFGGHYQAFVKDVAARNQWARFNDSQVTPLVEAEWESGFGDDGIAKADDSPKPLTAKGGASAYMLMYRRMGSWDECSVDDAVIPADVMAHVQGENEAFLKEKEAQQLRRDTLLLRLVYGDVNKQIAVHKQTTLAEATQLLHTMFHDFSPGFTCTLDCVRVRGPGGEAYTGRESCTLAELGLRSGTALTLETRLPCEEFPTVVGETNKFSVHVKVFVLQDNGEFADPPMEIDVAADLCMPALKQQLASLCKIAVALIGVVCVKMTDGCTESADVSAETRLLKEVAPGRDVVALYVETRFAGQPSRLTARFELEKNTIEIGFNLPDSQAVDQQIFFDQRKTIGELKQAVATCIRLSCDDFRLCQSLLSQREFTVCVSS